MRQALVLFLLAGLLSVAPAAADPLPLTTKPIESFTPHLADAPSAPLTFLGGLIVTSSEKRFGGLSGIDMLDHDTAFIVGDRGVYVRMRMVHDNGWLVGLSDGEIGSLFPAGKVEKDIGDAEDVALAPDDRNKGVLVRERQANAMLAFHLENGRPVDFIPIRVGADNRILRSNQGLESVAYPPAASPLSGEIVTIAEHPPEGATDIPGWVAGVGSFDVVRRDDFDISSARFLPDGDLILLERRFSLSAGIAMRLRRIPGDTIKVGARLDGAIILDAGMTSQIDNMEGLAVSQDEEGRTILTLVSDDNYNILQRTLILQFALDGD